MGCVEVVKAVVGLVVLLADIVFVVVCSILHFLRGEQESGTIQGAFTLILFFTAGLVTNTFHFFRHEWPRMAQRSTWGKVRCGLLCLVPCSSLLRWYVGRCKNPESLSRRCWTSSLRLFYCSGTFTQAVMQSYVVVHLWHILPYQPHLEAEVYVTLVAAVVFSVHAMYGVCGYTWTGYYDETHTNLPLLDYLFILAALPLNMGGRVALMAVVMGTKAWYWLALAVMCPFLINYAVYVMLAPVSAVKGKEKVFLFLFLVPLALLSSITVSEKRVLTFITTLAWLGCSLPQIISFHDSQSEWLVWSIPVSAQIIAFVLMMVKWSAFEGAFERFSRLCRVNQFTPLPSKDRDESKNVEVVA